MTIPKSQPFDNYAKEYLTSAWWSFVKQEVIKRHNGRVYCEIGDWSCQKGFKRKKIIFHHLSYEHLGTIREIDDIVMVCSTCNYWCHFTLLRRKIPLTRKALTARYGQITRRGWSRYRPSDLLSWIVESYSLSKPTRQRTGLVHLR